MDTYNHKDIEEKHYANWEKQGYFSSDISQQKETYTIVIPPPNITGSLHIGHALVNTLQDILIRYKRLCGYKTLWLPGTDHAGIATQMLVERDLLTKGIKRKEIGQEKFIEAIWDWKNHYGNRITTQLRRLGASLDWEKEQFTMSPEYSQAVKYHFVSLYKKGYVFRDLYLVNWCPKDLTAISDLEVEHKDIEGSLVEIAYPLAKPDKEKEIIIATTRVETLLGDVAIAVHPDDERYQHLIGEKVVVPLVNREIPIIADSHCDPSFGSGAVKITPAHDPNDFAIAQRHNLDQINIFDEQACLNDIYPPLQGIDRFQARTKILELLKETTAFRSQSKHVHSVGHCHRCGTIVEPRLSVQWFCRMKDMADRVLKKIDSNDLQVFPKNQKKILQEWLLNIHDWCISRQLWWGHRIPAFYCCKCDHMIVEENIEGATCSECGHTEFKQDSDVLDTWFSSGLFPFAGLGWPKKTQNLADFYPTSTLVTAYDILFFWVARMLMLGLEHTDQLPFKEVFLHGLVRDEKGEKMSKTKGNVVDPLQIIEEYGADALRFTLAYLTTQGRDIKIADANIKTSRNFINKLWNATKFTLFHVQQIGEIKDIDTVDLGVFDTWIYQQLEETTGKIHHYLAQYRFDEASRVLYTFIRSSLCDNYIEICKPILFEKQGKQAQLVALATLWFVLKKSLILLHPFIPFVTEEIWLSLDSKHTTVSLESFPQKKDFKPTKTTNQANLFIELINAIRSLRGENNIALGDKVNIAIVTQSQDLESTLTQFADLLLPSLTKVNNWEILQQQPANKDSWVSFIASEFELFLQVNQATRNIEQELSKFTKDKAKLLQKLERIQSKLSSEDFLSKAPEQVIGKNKQEQQDLEAQLSKIEEHIAKLG